MKCKPVALSTLPSPTPFKLQTLLDFGFRFFSMRGETEISI